MNRETVANYLDHLIRIFERVSTCHVSPYDGNTYVDIHANAKECVDIGEALKEYKLYRNGLPMTAHPATGWKVWYEAQGGVGHPVFWDGEWWRGWDSKIPLGDMSGRWYPMPGRCSFPYTAEDGRRAMVLPEK